jgi:hypothetical protein
MPRESVDFETVRQIAMALPAVKAATSYGATSFKVRGRLLACPAINRSAEPGSLMVRIDLPQRTELLAAEPDVYYLTPHYEPYSSVLVRLERISRESLRNLLGLAWVFVTSEAPKGRRKARKTRAAGRKAGTRRMRGRKQTG